MLATTIAWDNVLSWTWGNAINDLEATIRQVQIIECVDYSCLVHNKLEELLPKSSNFYFLLQVSSRVVKLRKEAPRTFILSNNHIPSKAYWEFAVNQALQIISRSDSELVKVLMVYVLSFFEVLTNSGSE